MKNLILLLAITISLISCSKSKEDIVKNNIETWMQTNLNDPSSYEFVSLGSLIPDTAIDYDSEMSKNLIASLETYERDKNIEYGGEEMNILHQKLVKAEKEYIDSISVVWNKHIQQRKVNKGYVAQHTFRAKNALGALIIHNYEFIINEDLSVSSIKNKE